MKVKSRITGMEYEVDTYSSESGRVGIQHESLQHILENELIGVDYEIDVITATPSYCAVKCTIRGEIKGKKRVISRVNDVNASILENRDPSMRNFTIEHPLIVATNAAVDAAVKGYLDWPNVLSSGTTTTVVNDDDKIPVPDDIVEENPELADEEIPELIDEPKETPENEFTGMNPPEPNDIPDGEDETENSDDARIIELGETYPPANCKYGKLTLAEIWDQDKGWMDYIKNNNRSKAYEKVREYIRLRQEKEGIA